jgi:hypothetical protein
MLYEINVPPRTPHDEARVLQVEAANWLAALRKALQTMGDPEIPRGKALCDIRQDGTIAVDHPGDGRKFLIRPVRGVTQPALPAVRPEGPSNETTFPYIEAAIQDEIRSRYPAANPMVSNVPVRTPTGQHASRRLRAPGGSTGGHPCLVMDRAEVLRRFEAARSQTAQSTPVPESSGTPNRSPWADPVTGDQPALNLPVVEVETSPGDSLSAVRVDLDSLRQQAALRTPSASTRGAMLASFNWVVGPLQAAIDQASSAQQMAENVLRLALAALPSRTAFVALHIGDARQRIFSSVGEYSAHLQDRSLFAPNGVFRQIIATNVSMALGSDRNSAAELDRMQMDLGIRPNDALLVCMCQGSNPGGTLAILNSLDEGGYSADHLVLLQAVAERLVSPLFHMLRSRTSPV